MGWIKALLFLTSLVCYGQVVPHPRFLHEQLALGSDYRSVFARVAKLKKVSQGDFNNPFFKKDAATISVSYVDTLFGKPAGILLSFSKSDSLLNSILVTFLGVDPKTGKSTAELDESIEALWDSVSNHFGTPQREKKIPLMGKMRVWLFASTEVQLTRLTLGTSLVTVQYLRRK